MNHEACSSQQEMDELNKIFKMATVINEINSKLHIMSEESYLLSYCLQSPEAISAMSPG